MTLFLFVIFAMLLATAIVSALTVDAPKLTPSQRIAQLAGESGGVNLGTSRLTPPPLVAGATAQIPFRDLDAGYVDSLLLHLTFGLKSTAAAFAFVTSTGAAEGVDDLDLLLNTMIAQFNMYWEADNIAFNGLTPAQLRTWLILSNSRDINGTLVNGSSVPVSSGAATSFRLTLPIPVSLRNYFKDGGCFGRGTISLESGRLEIGMGASLTPTIVLANGSAVVSSFAASVTCQYGEGDPSDHGPTYRIRRPSNLKPIGEKFPAATRLALLDMTSNAPTHVTGYSFLGYRNAIPADFASRYQSDRMQNGTGYDLTARCTPLIFPDPKTTVTDYTNVAEAEWTWDVTTSDTALTIMEVWSVNPNPSTQSAIAMKVGKGGRTASTVVRPASIGPGEPIPAAVQSMVQFRTRAGSNGTVQNATPQAAGAVVQSVHNGSRAATTARNAARARRR